MADEDDIVEDETEDPDEELNEQLDPTSPDVFSEQMYDDFTEYVATRYGYSSMAKADAVARAEIRTFVDKFLQLISNVNQIEASFVGPNRDQTRVDRINEEVRKLVLDLASVDGLTDDLVREYVDAVQNADSGSRLTQAILLRGYKVTDLVTRIAAALAVLETQTPGEDYDYVRTELQKMGPFEPVFDHIDYKGKMAQFLSLRRGRFRHDTAPAQIARWQCRVGASTFLVPPTSVNVSQEFYTGSLTGGAIRQPTSPKTNLGYSDTTITMSLIFPNHESIWGFVGDKGDLDIFNWEQKSITSDNPSESERNQEVVSDAFIDYYLSSLRGLLTQFKYSPILPIRNEYINRTYGISAVALAGMSLSTVPGFPFVISVNLQMKKFNHKVVLPMVEDFDQALHWGKFRQYLGKASLAMDAKTNEGFLTKADPLNYYTESDIMELIDAGSTMDEILETLPYEQVPGVPTLNKLKDIQDGRNFEFYFPKTTPSRIFAPDTTDFRQYGENNIITEDVWDGFLSDIGLDIVQAPRFNFFEYSNAANRISSEKTLLNDWLGVNGLIWQNMNTGALEDFVDAQISRARADGRINSDNSEYEAYFRSILTAQWYYTVFSGLVGSTSEIEKQKKKIEDSNQYRIKEWEVPMEKLYVDWSKCLVQGITVGMSNNFAPMRPTMQEDPAYQYTGGGDSTVNLSMIVIGEENMIRFRRLYQHINGLARLEKGHGVLGFLGIKNVLTALCGIKYVLPLSFNADTVEGMPHVYTVQMSFVDFDVRQQQREQLDITVQKSLVQSFGKRNPFLRVKQAFNQYNAYPEFPLAVNDDDGTLLGYLDPDWYFRSFVPRDRDTYEWNIDNSVSSLIVKYNNLNNQFQQIEEINATDPETIADRNRALTNVRNEIASVEENLREIYQNTGQLMPGYIIKDGSVVNVGDIGDPETIGQPEMRQYLGVFGENNEAAAFLDFFPGGFFMLGTEDTKSHEESYVLGMSAFREDLASQTVDYASTAGTVPLSDYQHEYFGGDRNPNKQFEIQMQDQNYRSIKGRMLACYPTYMLWLIDEGGRFTGVKLYDNLYGLNSIIDFSVNQDTDSMQDTMVLTLSNIYQKLTTPFRETLIPEDSDLYETPVGQWIRNVEDRQRNLIQGMTDEILELNSIRLKPGVRVHMRAGYGSSPNALQTLFNGVITEVGGQDIMTITCQSDAHELSAMVNSTDSKGHTGKLAGGINTGFWLCEPRDLIVRLLSMGSSYFKEWISWGTKGVVFSDSKFGIRHFGNMLYEYMTDEEEMANQRKQAAGTYAALDTGRPSDSNRFRSWGSGIASELSSVDSVTALPGATFDFDLVRIAQYMWANQFTNRDYEIFKRNIYPGNGTGIAQFMAGDQIDAGLAIQQITAAAGQTEADDEAAEELIGNGTTSTSNEEDTPGFFEQVREAFREYRELREQNEQHDENVQNIDAVWTAYADSLDITDEELFEIIGSANTESSDLTEVVEEREGFFESIINNDAVQFIGLTGLSLALGPFGPIGRGIGLLINPLNKVIGDAVFDMGAQQGGVLGSTLQIASFFIDPGKPIRTAARLASSVVGQTLGLTAAIADDDLNGYDEVSFRAQTYMKSVWDVMRVCARLLPNYIIAVRPFEDRSTLFYGKPHWLYTSGVIPVSSGVGADPNLRPRLSEPNYDLGSILSEVGILKGDKNWLSRLADESGMLKEILEFGSADVDPYSYSGNTSDKYVNADAANTVSQWYTDKIENNDKLDDTERESIKNLVNENSELLSGLTPDRLNFVLELIDTLAYRRDDNLEQVAFYDDLGDDPFNMDGKDFYNFIKDDSWESAFHIFDDHDFEIEDITDEELADLTPIEILIAIAESNSFGSSEGTDGLDEPSDLAMEWLRSDESDVDDGSILSLVEIAGRLGDVSEDPQIIENVSELLMDDPITFAYQFGWKFSFVPVWIDPATGFGYDKVGDMARMMWDEDYSTQVDAPGEGSTLDHARDIWEDMRKGYFRADPRLREVWERYHPWDADQVNAAVDLFLRFLWQDPFNRAWAVTVAEQDEHGNISLTDPTSWPGGIWDMAQDALSDTVDNNTVEWIYEKHLEAFEIFISNPISEDGFLVRSGATRTFMESNNTLGGRNGNPFSGAVDDVKDWLDRNIGQVLSMIGDTMTGFVSSIRLSLAQMGNALGAAGEFQKQANILNSSFNDSIYYQMGGPNSLLRLCDNPFTREYGEPVVEIREPFQRIHFFSSWDAILHNGIIENLNDVATVVTAVSDGKYPVRVHLDKGIPPERQVETIVETGLYWDNAMGSGLMGMFQPLIHPFETIRSYTKAALGSSDELSSRRVALSYLKEGLQNIYGGELLVIGNPDVRPFDLVYIADVDSRMYGMFEVRSVKHHFTPDQGYVTAITPSALVTINDPARWSLLSYTWSKLTNYNTRDDVRAALAVTTDRTLASASKEISMDDAYEMFGSQLQGAIQFTQGNSAIIRDIGAAFTGNGIDNLWNQVAKMDIAVGGLKAGLTVGGAVVGGLASGGAAAGVGGAVGFLFGDLLWEGWQWVKDNLLDQHGCYIQFLNKDGQPMDAGLSYYQGLAVGTNHTIDLLPNVLGLGPGPSAQWKNDGNYRITTNDLMGALGWSEIETTSIFREASYYINQINSNILEVANRQPFFVNNDNTGVILARILGPTGEELDESPNFGDRGGDTVQGVVDGDTLNVYVFDGNGVVEDGIHTIRLASMNTAELRFKNNPYSAYNETLNNDPNDLALLAYQYLVQRFTNPVERIVAIRVDKSNLRDDYNRIVGVVFHNTPAGTVDNDRRSVLEEIAKREPPIAWDSFLDDGRPYTLNWEMIMTGYGNVDMRESLWDSTWRDQAIAR